jgi:uncharacterized membrane protein
MRTAALRTVIYLAAGVGLIVSIFAALEFYEASLQSLCSINAFFSCSTVDRSGQTSTLGVPDYLWGIGGFVVVLLVAGMAESRPRDRRWPILLLSLTSLGTAFSLYFFWVQLAVIGAFCVVCTSAYVFEWVAWVGAIVLVRQGSTRTLSSDGDVPPDDSAPAE